MRTTAVIAAALALGSLGVTSNVPAQGLDLEALRWKHRPLLLFAPSPAAPLAKKLREGLKAAAAEVADRDMVVIEVYGERRASLDGEELPPGTAEALQRRLGVAEGASVVVLLGKDGGEKLRTHSADLGAVFALIDTMPMRRREMAVGGGGAAPR